MAPAPPPSAAGAPIPSAAAPANGDSVLLAVSVRLTTAQIGQWREKRAEVLSIAPSAAARPMPPQIAGSDNGGGGKGGESVFIHFPALPLVFLREWGESMWANITSPRPQLFFIYRLEENNGCADSAPPSVPTSAPTLAPRLTVAGDEAAGYGETDDTVLSLPMPHWLLLQVRAFVACHYKPKPKKVRRRQ